jgi:hypothetical protein
LLKEDKPCIKIPSEIFSQLPGQSYFLLINASCAVSLERVVQQGIDHNIFCAGFVSLNVPYLYKREIWAFTLKEID